MTAQGMLTYIQLWPLGMLLTLSDWSAELRMLEKGK